MLPHRQPPTTHTHTRAHAHTPTPIHPAPPTLVQARLYPLLAVSLGWGWGLTYSHGPQFSHLQNGNVSVVVRTEFLIEGLLELHPASCKC